MKVESNTLLLSSKEMAGFLNKSCAKGIPFKFTARGMSMSPFICDGDAVVIEPALHRKIHIGDIVAFICPENGILIIHRIVAEQNDKYLLKGDNVFHCDGWIRRKDIHGYVKDVIVLNKNTFGLFFQRFFLFLNKFKKINAALSRYYISTIFCRISNKFN